jgi:hypothetical protein
MSSPDIAWDGQKGLPSRGKVCAKQNDLKLRNPSGENACRSWLEAGY